MFYPTAGQEGSFGSVVSPSSVCLSSSSTLPVSVQSASTPPASSQDHHLNHLHEGWSEAEMTLSSAISTITDAVSKSKKKTPFRSTKGASKQRRDLINAEIKNLRDLLPLPDSVKARLSYLHVMSLACVYTRKCNFFSQDFASRVSASHDIEKIKQEYDFSPVLNGFLLIVNSEGYLLYISENVTEFLGHSMVDLLTQGGSVFDVVDDRDHATIRTNLKYYENHSNPKRSFFCRMNTSRSMRRQDNCSDNKVVHITGRYHSMATTSSWSPAPVFIGVCSPISSSICRTARCESSVLDTMSFTTQHGLDMRLQEVSSRVVYHLGYTAEELYATSWYNLLYANDDVIGRTHHQYLIQQVQQGNQTSCEFVVRMLTKDKLIVNVFIHATSHPDELDTSPIICENRVICDTEMQYYKAIQQNVVVDTMISGDEYMYPSSLHLDSSGTWPTDELESEFFPETMKDDATDEQFLNPTSPEKSSSSKDNAFVALKDATMELVRRRLRKRLHSDQSCLEPQRKACRFDNSLDDNYDVKFRTYSLSAINQTSQESSGAPPSSIVSTLTTDSHTNREQRSETCNWAAESPSTMPVTPMTPLNQQEHASNRLDILCPYRLPHAPDSTIRLKQEICVPDSMLTPDPSPKFGQATPAQTHFDFTIDEVPSEQLPNNEEKTLTEEDLNTLRELASTLLTLTKDCSDIKNDIDTNVNIGQEDINMRHTSVERDHCVPSVEGSRMGENPHESLLLADKSFYATSPVGCIQLTVQHSTNLSAIQVAAGQHKQNLETIDQLQLNLSCDQESLSSSSSSSSHQSEQSFSDASSFMDELESIDMELTSSPSTTPSHGELGFCELDLNTSINSFH
ncbi:uncharacterized protein LOC102810196 [Saccoglossus kowalevskii]